MNQENHTKFPMEYQQMLKKKPIYTRENRLGMVKVYKHHNTYSVVRYNWCGVQKDVFLFGNVVVAIDAACKWNDYNNMLWRTHKHMRTEGTY